ncbi:MAG: queuosine precursor transporter [Bacteroidia bacterium]
MQKINNHKKTVLMLVLGSFFIANAIIAEFVGVKVFSLEQTLGFNPLQLKIFGHEISLNMTAGVLLWPFVFVMTDIINEYYGFKAVRLFSYLAAFLIAYAFAAVYGAIHLTPADFWTVRLSSIGPLNMQVAYENIFGQGLWIIAGSLVAFLLGQLVDVAVFHFVKSKTGEKMLWLRATGSTLVSQFIDSFVVLFIAFYVGAGFSLSLVLAIGIINYAYKFIVALTLTPVLYIVHAIIDYYLGSELAEEMLKEAHESYKN